MYHSLQQAQLGGVPGTLQLVRSFLVLRQANTIPGLEVCVCVCVHVCILTCVSVCVRVCVYVCLLGEHGPYLGVAIEGGGAFVCVFIHPYYMVDHCHGKADSGTPVLRVFVHPGWFGGRPAGVGDGALLHEVWRLGACSFGSPEHPVSRMIIM